MRRGSPVWPYGEAALPGLLEAVAKPRGRNLRRRAVRNKSASPWSAGHASAAKGDFSSLGEVQVINFLGGNFNPVGKKNQGGVPQNCQACKNKNPRGCPKIEGGGELDTGHRAGFSPHPQPPASLGLGWLDLAIVRTLASVRCFTGRCGCVFGG